MGLKVVFTDPAIGDLAGIVKYISRNDPAAAERVGFGLIEKAEKLGDFPYLGRLVPERAERDCREIIARPYRIIYRVLEDKGVVQVLRFWHAARGTPDGLTGKI